MANWCEGILKIKGERKDIVDFLKNALEIETTSEKPEVVDNEDGIELINNYNDCYVKNTKNGFIDCNLYYGRNHNFIAVKYYQERFIKTEELAAISECYNLDFKILAKEVGCMVIQDIEIHKGMIVKDICKEYDDRDTFIWDAPDLLDD